MPTGWVTQAYVRYPKEYAWVREIWVSLSMNPMGYWVCIVPVQNPRSSMPVPSPNLLRPRSKPNVCSSNRWAIANEVLHGGIVSSTELEMVYWFYGFRSNQDPTQRMSIKPISKPPTHYLRHEVEEGTRMRSCVWRRCIHEFIRAILCALSVLGSGLTQTRTLRTYLIQP